MEDLLDWLQRIYEEDFCNGSWEHVHGVEIDTLDPGWDFSFDLQDTDMEEIEFEKVFIQKDENDWYQCWIEKGVFRGWGGPRNLTDVLQVFHDWYEETSQQLDKNK